MLVTKKIEGTDVRKYDVVHVRILTEDGFRWKPGVVLGEGVMDGTWEVLVEGEKETVFEEKLKAIEVTDTLLKGLGFRTIGQITAEDIKMGAVDDKGASPSVYYLRPLSAITNFASVKMSKDEDAVWHLEIRRTLPIYPDASVMKRQNVHKTEDYMPHMARMHLETEIRFVHELQHALQEMHISIISTDILKSTKEK